MYSTTMAALGRKRSVIREIFEYSKSRKEVIGADKVFDFSIGNPSVPAPPIINKTLIDLITNVNSIDLHGYTSAQGDKVTRETIANYITASYGCEADAKYIYMTVGAAAALSIVFNALETGNDEVIIFAPYFPEYKVFIQSAFCKHVVVPPDPATLLPDLEAFEESINLHTKAVVLNSPNNPSGVVYPLSTIVAITDILKRKSLEFGHPIFLVSDEPYRELVYDGITVPYVANYYDNTIICYSFSKVWSIPGERIGYISVNPKMKYADDIYAAICGAGRKLGYICAPSLFQKLVERCIGAVGDVEAYRQNRDLLYNSLTEFGFNCVHPDGAFYLFARAPLGDSKEFYERAKKYEILFVPADDFGGEGYVRIAYCVSKQQILNSLPAFRQLAVDYDLIT